MTTSGNEKPLYLGHRARLRERFLADEGASMPDYEVLELILTMSIPRRDVKPLAKKLIKKYGDLASVIKAPQLELIDDCKLSVTTIALLKLISTSCIRISSASFSDSKKSVITQWDEFKDSCRHLMAFNDVEEFRIFFFDDAHAYLGTKLMNKGTVNKTFAHPREIIKAALDCKATSIVLAHNHPSGESKPSQADIQLTDTIVEAAELVDIEVFDHLIITRNDIFSFRDHGLIHGVPKKR